MAQFAFLYIGSGVPDGLEDQLNQEWGDWMTKIGASGKLKVAGAPFGGGSVVGADGVKTYSDSSGSNVGGYSIVEAATIQEAIALTKGCPQIDPKYGKGKIEVREVYEM